jgi:hypothetical protein
MEGLPAPDIGFAQYALDFGAQAPSWRRLIAGVELKVFGEGLDARSEGVNQRTVCRLRGTAPGRSMALIGPMEEPYARPGRIQGESPTPLPGASRGKPALVQRIRREETGNTFIPRLC